MYLKGMLVESSLSDPTLKEELNELLTKYNINYMEMCAKDVVEKLLKIAEEVFNKIIIKELNEQIKPKPIKKSEEEIKEIIRKQIWELYKMYENNPTKELEELLIKLLVAIGDLNQIEVNINVEK